MKTADETAHLAPRTLRDYAVWTLALLIPRCVHRWIWGLPPTRLTWLAPYSLARLAGDGVHMPRRRMPATESRHD
jgi:hypothetical protein